MKEEEIIEIVKDYIQYKETDGHIQAKTIGLIDEAIQGLLDLYEKEKEKNKELEKYKKYYKTEKVVWSRKDYISKDKIREKIEELYEMEWTFNEIRDEIINILQQLLEE